MEEEQQAGVPFLPVSPRFGFGFFDTTHTTQTHQALHKHDIVYRDLKPEVTKKTHKPSA
jgi:hypothetical protein